jgi:beta-glucosidase
MKYRSRHAVRRRTAVAATAVVAASTAAATVAVLSPGTLRSAAALAAANSSASCPWVDSNAPVATRVAELLGKMTLDDKIQLLHGNGKASPYIGNITGIPSLCIPTLGFQDGPAGVGDGLDGVTQMPSGNASAATFDTSYEEQYGAAIGAEFVGKGVAVALGPTLNIDRDPRWGRAFETFSEDPYLSGQMTAADVKGLQSKGVIAEIKHAAVYNVEHPAGTVAVSHRTIQEIYLPAFQAAIAQAAPGAVMCAYSNVNNVPACQNPVLLKNGLNTQAGFKGFVGSDWGGDHSTVASIDAGFDIEMPNGYFNDAILRQAMAQGQIKISQVNAMVSRLLTQLFAFGMFNHAPRGSLKANVSTAAHVQVALKGAEEGTVLLKNTGILPLSKKTLKSIAVIGLDGGSFVQTIGGGSATVRSSATVWPITGIQNAVKGTNISVNYNDGTNVASATSLARGSKVAIVFASDNYGEEEHDTQGGLNLPNNQDALIKDVAAANPNTIVVLNDNTAILMPWLSKVKAVFEGFYDGQQWGTAIASLLFGTVNPSGKLPVTFPVSLSQVPAHTTAQWPGVNGKIQYSEGLDVGYRWYDTKGITPLFPFGFGLSYTTFAFSGLHVGPLVNGQARVTATITNTGHRQGTDVVQLYVGDPASAGEPPHQLKGFQRITLNPGKSATVAFHVSAYDLSQWITSAGEWKATAGTYKILVGDSSRNLPLSGSVVVPATIATSVQAPDGITTAALKAAAARHAGTAEITNPGGMSSGLGQPAKLQIAGNPGLGYTATGLPPGLSISPVGLISGKGTRRGTYTITVTGSSAADLTYFVTFVWTVS